MVLYRRAYIPGATFFFTLVTYQRQTFLTQGLARKCLHNAWQRTQELYPFELNAICLLPDHLHCIWTLPEGDSDFSKRWKMIKSLFTKSWLQNNGHECIRNKSMKNRREAGIWQHRFWEHVIRDENDFSNHFDYIHYNPVKHKYIDHPVKWPWSTFHKYVNMGWYDPDWGNTEDCSSFKVGYDEYNK